MDETRFSRRRLLAAAGTTLSAAIAGCSLSAPEQQPTSEETDSSPNGFPEEFDPPEQDDDLPPAESGFAKVYRAFSQSVAAVRIESTEQRDSSGSAWVYEDNYLVTNEHVVRGVDEPFVWFTNTGWREAAVVGRDPYSDLAVIEVTDKPEETPALPVAGETRAVGTQVAAIGNPFDLTGSFTTGIISGQNRTIPIPDSDFSIADGIQTDAALNPGNSGGPLVTMDGQVIGVVNAGGGDNIGFAISAAMVENVVPSLIETGSYEHSYMGVLLGNVSPRIIDANNLPVSWGVYISEVRPGGPADGVLEGSETTQRVRGRDTPVGGDVIVRMGDWQIPNRERLSAYLALETQPGDTFEVEFVRDGSKQVADLTVGSRPTPQ